VFVFYLISSIGGRVGVHLENCSRGTPIVQYNFYIRHCYGIKKVTKKLFKLYVCEFRAPLIAQPRRSRIPRKSYR
jgi:hypothetical protein